MFVLIIRIPHSLRLVLNKLLIIGTNAPNADKMALREGVRFYDCIGADFHLK